MNVSEKSGGRKRVLLASFIALLILATVMLTRESKPSGAKTTTPSSLRYVQIVTPPDIVKDESVPGEAVIKIWRETAKKHAINDAAIENVSNYYADVFQFLRLQMPVDQRKAFAESLDRWVEQNKPRLNHKKEGERDWSDGAARWLVWCTVEALARPKISIDKQLAVVREYQDLALTATRKVSVRVKATWPAEDYADIEPYLTPALKLAEPALSKQVQELNADYLCPAFKNSPTEKQKTSVMERSEIIFKYDARRADIDRKSAASRPKEDDDETPDEKKAMHQKDVIQQQSEIQMALMFSMFVNERAPSLSYNDYWGHIAVGFGSDKGFWPVGAWITVSEYQNRKWERREKKAPEF